MPDEVVSTYGELKKELQSFVEMEKHKYPLTDREEAFVSILSRLLDSLDYQVLTGVLR